MGRCCKCPSCDLVCGGFVLFAYPPKKQHPLPSIHPSSQLHTQTAQTSTRKSLPHRCCCLPCLAVPCLTFSAVRTASHVQQGSPPAKRRYIMFPFCMQAKTQPRRLQWEYVVLLYILCLSLFSFFFLCVPLGPNVCMYVCVCAWSGRLQQGEVSMAGCLA